MLVMADGTEPLSSRADMFVSGRVGFTNSGGTAEIFCIFVLEYSMDKDFFILEELL